MPTESHIESDSGTAIMVSSGILRPDEARATAAALWKDPNWRGEAVVWDFRSAEFDLSSVETRELATFILSNQRTPPPRRIAFVTQREVDFGMARMYGTYREAPATRFSVFRNFEAACEWAKLDTGDTGVSPKSPGPR